MGFSIDITPVTNAAYARFVAEVGYLTVAERPLDPALYPDALPELMVPGVAHEADAAKPCCTPENPRGAAIEGSYDPGQPRVRIPRKVVKGGSYLCAPSYCRRYRPAARQSQMTDSAMSHIGFRCISREFQQQDTP